MKTNEEILEKRALELAVDNSIAAGSDGGFEVVDFMLGSENYAIDSSFVTEVFFLKDLTVVPGIPAFIAGVTNVRGKIVSVVDLKQFLDIKQNGITEHNRVLILSNKKMEFGVLADAILGTSKITNECLMDSNQVVGKSTGAFVRGITNEGLIVLNAAALLADKSMIIHQKQ